MFSVLRTGRLYLRKYSWYSFLLEVESTPGHSAAGRIMSMKNSNATIGNRNRDLPAQPTALPRNPFDVVTLNNSIKMEK